MSSLAPTTTSQVISTINTISTLGSFAIPAIITLWKGWQQSRGVPSTDLFAESDVELDATIADVLAREERLGYPTT